MAIHHRDITEAEFNAMASGSKAFVDAYELDEYQALDVIVFRAKSSAGKALVSKHKIIQVLNSTNTNAIKKNHVIAFVGEAF
ncbi:hypothetical protein NM925_002383 [Vibrio cholerae]|nr:hypothetical protein [Vibrio cholerae]EGR4345438.1 hypothetical protein [Vibrio cholerae]EJL9414366.1 hypothetical protein [Vibrio cholerae]GHW96112.1 hypothetical protein VCSRO105_2190 [Vibrio cholerae]